MHLQHFRLYSEVKKQIILYEQFEVNLYVICVSLPHCSIIGGTRFPVANPGCINTYGGVTIPYPFGIGPDCALMKHSP